MMSLAPRLLSLWALSALLELPCLSLFADEKEKFPDEVEKPLAELVKSAVELKSSTQMDELKKAIEEIADTTKMADDAKKRLEVEAKAVVEQSLNPWKEKLDARLRPFLRQDIKESLELMTEWPAEVLIKGEFVPDSGKLTDQDEWKSALKKVLTPEQLAMIEKKNEELEQGKEKGVQDCLKDMSVPIPKRMEMVFNADADEVKKLFGLTGDRAKKIDELATETVKRSVEALKKQLAEKIRSMGADERNAWISGDGGHKNFTHLLDTGLVITEADDWKKALQGTLSAEEMKRWTVVTSSRVARKDKAMAMIFLSHMDTRIFLTAAQREKLEPHAVKVMLGVQNEERRSFLSSSGHESKFNKDDLKLILDQSQINHWEEGNNGAEVNPWGQQTDQSKPGKAAALGEGDIDEDVILNGFFLHCENTQRKRLADGMMLKLDDIKRSTKISKESLKFLEIASAGAVDHALDLWRQNFEAYVHNSVKNIPKKALRQRLMSVSGEVNFGDQPVTSNYPVWTNAVADVLTKPEMELWVTEVSSRKLYRDRARMLMVVAELDHRFHLSQEQMQKLEPLLMESVAEFTPEFNRNETNGGDYPNAMLAFLAGVPEAKTKSILLPLQFEQWRSSDFKDVEDTWNEMKQTHNARKKRGKNR